MSRVSISRKTAQFLAKLVAEKDGYGNWGGAQRAVDELRAALKPKRSVAPARKRKAAKAKTRKEETSEIREAVFARAGGHCECGCGGQDGPGMPLTFANQPGELDHFWGRGKAQQTVENCWALSRLHHRAKTLGIPDRAGWISAFIRHCEKHGYSGEAGRAKAELYFVETKSELSRQSKERAAQ